MVGRMVNARVKLDKVDEVIDLGRKAVARMGELKPQGYQGYLSLVDRNTGKWVTIQLFDTEADANAWASSARARELLGSIVSSIAEPPVAEILEVAIRA